MKIDILEIGVADFDIMSMDSNKPCLLVECHPEHIQVLQQISKVNWKILNGAMVGIDMPNKVDFFFIPNKNCPSGYGPRGQGSIGKPNPTFLPGGYWYSLNKFLTSVKVTCYNFEQLVNMFSIEEIGTLKIDAEGADADILEGYIFALKAHPKIRARKIIWEFNELTPKENNDRVVFLLESMNYDVKKDGFENMLAIDKTAI